MCAGLAWSVCAPTTKDPNDPALKPVAAGILDEFARGGVLTVTEIDAAMRRFKKALIERALGAELTHHAFGQMPIGRRQRRRRNGELQPKTKVSRPLLSARRTEQRMHSIALTTATSEFDHRSARLKGRVSA